MKNILNIAFYKFVTLENLDHWRDLFKDLCTEHELGGTVIVSPEGINVSLAGPVDQVRQWLAKVEQCAEFKNLEVKESFSDKIPFAWTLIKIKKEVIPAGYPGIEPAKETGPRISPQELKKWFDEKREFYLIDTRNGFEYDHGTFEGATHFDLKTFREFPVELGKNAERLKDKPVVMFCTGGIRCEKATAVAMKLGLNNVYQLDGGILNYFKEIGGEHYRGKCFVFDERVALKPDLTY